MPGCEGIYSRKTVHLLYGSSRVGSLLPLPSKVCHTCIVRYARRSILSNWLAFCSIAAACIFNVNELGLFCCEFVVVDWFTCARCNLRKRGRNSKGYRIDSLQTRVTVFLLSRSPRLFGHKILVCYHGVGYCEAFQF